MKPIYTLMINAFLIALIWRLEIEINGWDGLTWLEYSHWAIIVGGMLWLMWIWLTIKSNKRSTKIIAISAIWGIVAYIIFDYAASAYFVGGPSAVSYMMTLGQLFDHIYWISPVIWGSSILLLYAGYRTLFRFSLTIWSVGFVIWMASWHLGLILICIIPEKGYHDLIHALKTGWMIPFCVIAVSLPIVRLGEIMSEQVSPADSGGSASSAPAAR